MRINVTRSSMPDFDAYCEEIRSLWDSRWLTNNGEKALRLEALLREKLNCRHVLLFTNGHLALEALLRSLNVTGGEVITTPFTFASTTHAITRCGATPVFCDVRESDYTLDPAKVEALITPRTRAILPVHVYGNLCAAEELDRIAARHGIPVVYDAAHTFGVTRGEKTAANLGRACMISFHATKVFHTIEGGCLATDDDELARLAGLERNYGFVDAETVIEAGGNAKMNEFQAAMGILNLQTLDEVIRLRKAVHERYVQNLSAVPGLRLPPVQEGVTPNYIYFPVWFEGGAPVRNAVCEALAEKGVFARKYFYPLTNDFDCYREMSGGSAKTPVARRIAEGIATLPLYPELPLQEADAISGVIAEVLRHG